MAELPNRERCPPGAEVTSNAVLISTPAGRTEHWAGLEEKW